MAAAVVERREPLSLLYRENSQDLGRLSPAVTTLLQQLPQKKFVRKSASLGASRAAFAANAELVKPSPTTVEHFVIRGAMNKKSSPESMGEDRPRTAAVSLSQIRPVVEEPEAGTRPTSASHHEQTENQGSGETGRESLSLMQLEMEALTWAAMAKDQTILSLETRLRTALEIAKAEQESNRKLEALLRERTERQEAMALELQDAKEQIGELIEAEERLAVQLGNLEVEAGREDRWYRSQITSLTDRIETQDRIIASSSPPELLPQLQESEFSKAQGSELEQSLAGKLDLAKQEIAALHADLSDARTDLRVSELIKRNQSRRLKSLQKERRHVKKKRAVRPVRSVPPAHNRSETEPPGGAGWKVFSILDFEV